MDEQRPEVAGFGERNALLERLSRIQRSISHGVPLQEVLDAIVSGAAQLFGDPVVALRLLDADDPRLQVLASAHGIDHRMLELSRHEPVGAGVGGRAIEEDRLVVLEEYARGPGCLPHFAQNGLQAAMAAPLHERGKMVGSLVVASYAEGRRYGESEREALLAFAEHASLALTDAGIMAERERLAEHHSEERFRSLVQHASDLITVVDAAGRIAYQSPSARRLLGTEPELLVGGRFADLVHPDDVAAAGAFLVDARATARVTGPVELRLVAADGAARTFELVATNLDADPHVRGLVLNGRDVTGRLRSERALRESERRYRQVVETTHDGVWITDAQGLTVYVNESVPRMTGRPAQSFIGRPLTDFLDAGPPMDESDRRRPRHADRYEATLERADGSLLSVLVSATPVRDDHGRHAGSLALVSDISDLVSARADRAVLADRLQRAQALETLDNLAGEIAHDVNNVVTVILSHAFVVRERLAGTDDDLRRSLDAIADAARHAEALTAQLLAYSRPGGDPEPLDLSAAVDGALRMLEAAIPEEVQLERRLAGDGPPVLADATQLRQVVLNLVDNALDAMAERGGVLTVQTRAVTAGGESHRAARLALPPGDYMALTVTDTGTGMEPDVAVRALEPLFTTKPRGTGTGFGLSIVHRAVEHAGGHLELRSVPGRGTTVEVLLPAECGAAAGPPRHGGTRCRRGAGGRPGAR
jgi:two-component system, cell cycle sensor histidine kinase and response regulator CckA